ALPETDPVDGGADASGIIDDLQIALGVAGSDRARRQRHIGQAAAIKALPGAVAADDEALHAACLMASARTRLLRRTSSRARSFWRRARRDDRWRAARRARC